MEQTKEKQRWNCPTEPTGPQCEKRDYYFTPLKETIGLSKRREQEKDLSVWTRNTPKPRIDNPHCLYRDISSFYLFYFKLHVIVKNPVQMSNSSTGSKANIYRESSIGKCLCTLFLHTLSHLLFTIALGSVKAPVFRWEDWGSATWNKQHNHPAGKLRCYVKSVWSQNACILTFNLQPTIVVVLTTSWNEQTSRWSDHLFYCMKFLFMAIFVVKGCSSILNLNQPTFYSSTNTFLSVP